MYSFLKLFADIPQLWLFFYSICMLLNRPYKSINKYHLMGAIVIINLFSAFFHLKGTPVMMASAYLIKNILFILSVMAICRTDIIMSLALAVIVGFIPAPLMAFPPLIASKIPYLISDNDLYAMFYGIFYNIGLIIFILIFKKLLVINLQQKLIRFIYKARFIFAFLFISTTAFYFQSALRSNNAEELLVADFSVARNIAIFLLITLVLVHVVGRIVKKAMAAQYEKINKQQEAIYKYYEQGMYLKHDYANILLSLKSTLDSENFEDIAFELEQLSAYTEAHLNP